jgi:hypothetical protein
MKTIFYSFFLIPYVFFAQSKKVSLPELSMEYEVPASWEVKSFFKGSWDKPAGNNICPCAGVINSVKIESESKEKYLFFVAYPSNRSGVNSDGRQGAWQYRFEMTPVADTIETDHLMWVRQISKFKTIASSRFKNDVVWRLNSKFGNTYYVIYFWADKILLAEKTATIEAIINSFKPIKN